MVEVAVFDEHRPDEDGADGWKLRDPSQLFERKIHVLQGQYRGGEQLLWRGLAEIHDPVVVSARQCISDVRVAHQEEPSANHVGYKSVWSTPIASMSARRACGSEAPSLTGCFTCGSRVPTASQSIPGRHSAWRGRLGFPLSRKISPLTLR